MKSSGTFASCAVTAAVAAVAALAASAAQAQLGSQARNDNVAISVKRCPTLTSKVCEEIVTVAAAPSWDAARNGWNCNVAVQEGVLTFGSTVDALKWVLLAQTGPAKYIFRSQSPTVDEPYGVYVYADATQTVFTPSKGGADTFTLVVNQRTSLAYAYGVYLDWVEPDKATKRCLGLDPIVINME